MYCQKCGKPNPDEVNFCQNCGNSLNPNTQASSGSTASLNHSESIPTSSQLMEMAKKDLEGKWGQAAGVTFIWALIPTAINAITMCGGSALQFPLNTGLSQYCLKLIQKEETKMGNLFERMGFNVVLAGAVYTIGIILACILLIVPGIILSLMWGMASFIAAERPELKAMEILSKSSQMMQGHKMRLFNLLCSFWAWILLVIVTFGIAGLWVIPYMWTSIAHFYRTLPTRTTV